VTPDISVGAAQSSCRWVKG